MRHMFDDGGSDEYSLSAANKLSIRCEWADTPAFITAGYGPGGPRGWPSDPCP